MDSPPPKTKYPPITVDKLRKAYKTLLNNVTALLAYTGRDFEHFYKVHNYPVDSMTDDEVRYRFKILRLNAKGKYEATEFVALNLFEPEDEFTCKDLEYRDYTDIMSRCVISPARASKLERLWVVLNTPVDV